MLTQISYFVQNKSLNIIYLLIFLQTKFGKSFFIHTCARKGTQSYQNLTFAQSVAKNFNFNISNVWCQIVLVPNCPVPNCPGAKMSGCQIVHFYYLGAKLSAFIILVPNCPLLLSWCQNFRFIILVLNCPVPNCPTILGSTQTRKKRKFHYELFASEKLVKKTRKNDLNL